MSDARKLSAGEIAFLLKTDKDTFGHRAAKEIKALREALAPIAEAGLEIPSHFPDEMAVINFAGKRPVTAGELRAIVAALKIQETHSGTDK